MQQKQGKKTQVLQKNKNTRKIYEGMGIYSYKLNYKIIIIKRIYNKYDL